MQRYDKISVEYSVCNKPIKNSLKKAYISL